MVGYNLQQAVDRPQRILIAADIIIATGEVGQRISLFGVIGKRQLPTGHGGANAAGVIQGQPESYASLRGSTSRSERDGTARLGRPTKLEDRRLVLICTL